MTNISYINGAFKPLAEIGISPLDRGMLFGDGIYDVIKCYNGKIFMLKEHMQRIKNSMNGLKFPKMDISNLEYDVGELLTRNKLTQGTALVYLQITRGTYDIRTHEFPKAEFNPTFFMTANPCPEVPKLGLKLATHRDIRWALCKYKTVNLLGNVLAKQAVVEKACDEVVMLRDGIALECSSSSLAIIKNEQVITHPEEEYILPSITVIAMRQLCEKQQIAYVEKPFSVEDVHSADEVLVLSTVRDISQASILDGKQVGGKDAATLSKMQTAFTEMMLEQCAEVAQVAQEKMSATA